MMRVLLCLVLLTRVATAEKVISERQASCEPKGAVWLDLQQKDTVRTAVKYGWRLYANGAVEISRKQTGKTSIVLTRCLSDERMAEAEGLLKGAPWTKVRAKAAKTCRARSTQSTVVEVYDNVVITEAACSAEVLDAKSAANLAKLRKLLPPAPPRISKECMDNPLAKGCN